MDTETSKAARLSELRIRKAGLHPGWLAALAIVAFLLLGMLAYTYGEALLLGAQVVVSFGLMSWSWHQRAQAKAIEREIERMQG